MNRKAWIIILIIIIPLVMAGVLILNKSYSKMKQEKIIKQNQAKIENISRRAGVYC